MSKIISLWALASVAGFASADPGIETAPIDIVGVSPVAGIGVPRRQIPANVQSVSGRWLDEQESLNLPELLARQLPSINVNEIQGNPFQPDLNYRGFTASPLLGTPQGLSVYVDGVRVNESFGDTVNWDLLPQSALAALDLIPGSNPVFGLNTLGGAIALRTKSGFSHPGSRFEASGGSFGRRQVELEHGGQSGNLAWYGAADWFAEDGWRAHSPSLARQLFGKLSYRDGQGDLDLALSRARSRLTGNGLVPESMLAQGRAEVFTHPDQTRNDLTQVTVNGRYWLGDASSLTGTVYHRRSATRTLNGDLDDDFAGGPFDGVANTDSGVHNRTRTRQRGSGGALQWNLATASQQLAVGAAVDRATLDFSQTAEVGVIDAGRGVGALAPALTLNALAGSTVTRSLYATHTTGLGPLWHLTVAARYNASRVVTHDQLRPAPPNLDGDHAYRKLNPALGLTWQALPTVDVYAGFSQGNRVPTPVELGCADAANPCTLPNALASDPALKQVVARTLEAGLRGQLAGGLDWNAGVFRTRSSDDILFVGTSTSAGYFTNFGQTRRQGLELGLGGRQVGVDWRLNYSYLQATFRESACLLSPSNSSRGQAAACTGGGQDDEILVAKGNTMPGLPAHSLKLALSWRAAAGLRLGADIQGFSSQVARGNENNRHQAGTATDLFGTSRTFAGPGRLPGYAVVNLAGEADLGAGWQAFAKINNVFDRRYGTAAALATNPFAANGAFQIDSTTWRHETFVAPGAPRAAWIGVRYAFGGAGS